MASEASCSHHVPMTMEATDKFEKYDVFLSHRGPDTKTGFVGFLYEGLKNHGLQPYLDCKSIRIGEDCWKSIEDGIKNTPIAVVVFSEGYAESEWCLKELHVMLEAREAQTRSHSCKEILPIFYNVEPRDVRHPERGKFAKGFEKLKGKFEEKVIEEWQADLKRASTLMGWEHSDTSTRDFVVELMTKVIQKIVELANKSLPLAVGEHLAGVKEVAEKLIQCQVLDRKVSALGLWGMGGIGKSTLAKELYNQLCKGFDASCYVEDVNDKLKQVNGVVEIQKRMLKDLCSNQIDNDNKSALKTILEERLCRKRIVVVLDDVPNVEMLNYMMTHNMLREGSICILTSRDKRVFEASNIFDCKEQKVHVHEVEMLNMRDSKQVFTSFALRRNCEMIPEYEELVTEISKLCCGVPLVLKVYGAMLKGDENLDTWKEVKRSLKCGGVLDDNKILDCLRLSYDFLEDKEKKMFLDIACALLGKPENMAICIWRSQGWKASLGVRNLKAKTLISVDDKGCFTMHDHLRDMGRKIERDEAKDSLRRLWMPRSLSLLEEEKPLPHSLQTLVIVDSYPYVVLDLSKMKELRILICDERVSLTSIPQNLRCLYDDFEDYQGDGWRGGQNFPKVPEKNQLAFLRWSSGKPTYDLLESLPRLRKLETLILEGHHEDILEISLGGQRVLDFEELHVLRYISLRYFNVNTILGFSSKHENLRYLELFECDSLRSCPGVGDLLALEELVIVSCPELEELPNLQQLTRLRKLKIASCKSIKAVHGLGNLVVLEEFTASECTSLVALPDMHKLTNLQTLNLLNNPALQGVVGLCELIALQMLSIEHKALEGGFNLHKLNKLVTLDVQNLSGPLAFTDVVSVEHLDIWKSEKGIKMMPNLLNLSRLQTVKIGLCSFKDVSCLGDLISLQSISISGCDSLETIPDMHKLTRLATLVVEHCPNVKVWAGVSRSKSASLFGRTLWADQPRSGTVMALRNLKLEKTGLTELLDLSLFPERSVSLFGRTLWVDQPRSGIVVALRTLELRYTGLTELPDLSLFPELKELVIWGCERLEGLISTMPMTALEWLHIYECPELQEVPDLSHCKLLRYCQISYCNKISLTRDEITKLEAMIPGLKTDFHQDFSKPSKRIKTMGPIYGASDTGDRNLELHA